jgi:fatty acid desaturase
LPLSGEPSSLSRLLTFEVERYFDCWKSEPRQAVRLKKEAAMRNYWRRRLLALQGLYYLVTGLWPLVHLPSFEAVTGPKTDDWLVHMVGLLAMVIGAALGVAVTRDHAQAPEVVVLATGAALAFGGIDFWYALGGRISAIYLADAGIEVAFLAGLGWTRASRGRHS